MFLGRKAEIAYLENDLTLSVDCGFSNEDVLRLEIPMANIEAVQVLQALDEMPEDDLGRGFIERVEVEILLQRSPLAQLHDYINVGVGPEAVVVLDEVGALLLDHLLGELAHDGDFVA